MKAKYARVHESRCRMSVEKRRRVAMLPPMATPLATPENPDNTSLEIVRRGMSGLRLSVCALLLLTLPFSEKVLGFHVQYGLAVPTMVLVVVANALFWRYEKRSPSASSKLLFWSLALDLLGIFAVLACAGGAANPLSALFLVHVALAAAILPLSTTLALSVFAACLFLALFAVPSGACCPEHPANGAFSTHLYGMWIAFALSAGIIATFVTRVRTALEERGREVAQLRREAADNARFRALATLAAGTAHELNTPLGTIAVLAGEIAEESTNAQAKAHAEAISAQIERCRNVLKRLHASGKGRGPDAQTAVAPAALRAISAWKAAHPDVLLETHLQCDGAPFARSARVSPDDLEAAVGALLDNAWFASKSANTKEAISVEISNNTAGQLLVTVEDHGIGVPEALRDRLGEPFLTTKEPGEGMGLGLWLVRRAVEEAGGSLSIENAKPRGTRVTLRLTEARS